MKNRIISVVFVGVLLTIVILWLSLPKHDYSQSERRQLASMPDVSIESLLNGSFMEKMQLFMMDSFPFRDGFRSVSGWMNAYVFQQKDNDGIYVENGYAVDMEYPLNETSVKRAGERISYIYNHYLKDTDVKIYLSIIPDKNYFVAEESGHLSMDYQKFVELIRANTTFATYLDLFPLLQIEDYYKTDVHWRQEQIYDVAKFLANGMETELTAKFTEIELDTDFYGVYCSQSGLALKPEPITYLTNDELAGCKVYDYEHEKEILIYDIEKAYGRDSYEMFLSGAISLITIENSQASMEKELIIFRDSFGSSIAPLLVNGYSKITLVDTRYIQSNIVGKYIQFDDQDVLFLYNTQVLNNSETMK